MPYNSVCMCVYVCMLESLKFYLECLYFSYGPYINYCVCLGSCFSSLDADISIEVYASVCLLYHVLDL